MPPGDIDRKLKMRIGREGRFGGQSKPIIFDLKKKHDKKDFLRLFSRGGVRHIGDDYAEQQRELFAVKNPRIVYTPGFRDEFEKYFASLQKKVPISHHGRWVYFPWLSTLVHILEDEDFQRVRTARNRNLIN